MIEPLVSICCQTYNHKDYITEALEGFLMQKTNFAFEILLRDDASTDGTTEICYKFANKYPDKIKLLAYTENQWQKGISPFRDNVKRAKGKYIALCEGDDYWTDPLKLQKQVDFLEGNNEYGLVHTQIAKLRVTEGVIKTSNLNREKTSFEDLLIKNCIATPTTCFRKDLLLNYLKEINPNKKEWIAGDTPIWLYIAFHSKIKYIDEPTIVYRIIAGSASNTNSSRQHFNFVKSRLSIKKYFIEKYKGSEEALKFIYNDFYRESEYHALKLKEIETLKGNIKNLREKGLIVKPFYLQLMYKTKSNEYIYKSLFFFYKIYNRIKLLI